ncbi:hypothetical protein TWF481_011889 [Arthrobotrys musiformis]|uniref:C2H2-type domain-containing protein n=1 Tax=Arthrobotrys musiformis TaxID=47236 RepID=A0AAV9VWZ0_9PEZI
MDPFYGSGGGGRQDSDAYNYGSPVEPYGRNGYPYPPQIDIGDDELGSPTVQFDDLHSPTYPPYHNWEYPSPISSQPSTQSSRLWGTGSVHSSRTMADDYPRQRVMSGVRCIFHWRKCDFRSPYHDEWVEHIYSEHFGHGDHTPHREREFGNTPTAWTCRFRDCKYVVPQEYDRQTLWDKKLVHIFEHFKYHNGKPEDIREDPNWMAYYKEMGFCSDDDYRGGVSAPPIQYPFQHGITELRKIKKELKMRGVPQDAPGEPRAIPPGEQITHYQYPPQAQYQPPQPPPAQYHGYQNMDSVMHTHSPFQDPNQYQYTHVQAQGPIYYN